MIGERMRFLVSVMTLCLFLVPAPVAWAEAEPGLAVDEAENRLVFTAGGSGGEQFILTCKPGQEPSFHFVINPRKPVKSLQGPATAPSSIELKVDGRAFKADDWQQFWTKTSPDFKIVVVLLQKTPRASDEWRKFNAEVVAALDKGSRMTLKTTLRNKETIAATFDLKGLKEGLDRLRRR